MSYTINISFFVLGIPFMVFVLSFPILLLIMAFMSEDEQAISLTYIWIYALIGLILYGEFMFMRGMLRRFLRYHGVDSVKEYYNQYYSKEAKVVKKKKRIETEERVLSLFDNLEVIEVEARRRAVEQEKFVLPDPSHVPFMPIQRPSSSRFAAVGSTLIFMRAALVVLIPMMAVNSLIMYMFGMPIIDLMWTFLFIEGMLLSFVGTGAGIHKPKHEDIERKGLLVFLVGKRGMEMDKKMFILSLGAFTVVLSLLWFAILGDLPTF